MKRKPEIVVSVSNVSMLESAIENGADAVEIGGYRLSLKAFSGSFTIEEIEKSVKYCHSKGKKIYVLLDAFLRNKDLVEASDYIENLYKIGVDAIKLSEPALINVSKKVAPNLGIHLTEQMNIASRPTVDFWFDLNIKRVALIKELTFKEIEAITKGIRENYEIEVLVHGNMCIAYSGRTLISNYMNGKILDKEDMKKYSLVEETRPGQYYKILEDENGTYVINDKEICMINYIKELIDCGANVFRIEGRIKTERDLASIVTVYREAIDFYFSGSKQQIYSKEWDVILNQIDHSEYCTGFFLGKVE